MEGDHQVIVDMLAPFGANKITIMGESAHVIFSPGYEKNKWLTDDLTINGYTIVAEYQPMMTFREEIKAKPLLHVAMFLCLLVPLGFVVAAMMASGLHGWQIVLAILGCLGFVVVFGTPLWWMANRERRTRRLTYRNLGR